MSSDNLDYNVRSILNLFTIGAGEGKQRTNRILYRTLAGPQQLPKAVQEIELLNTIKETLPENMHDVVDELYETFINSLISLTSIKGATIQMLTTQKTEFKFNNAMARRAIANKFTPQGMGGEHGAYGQ